MQKLLSLILCLALLFGINACNTDVPKHDPPTDVGGGNQENGGNENMLDGKKIIFIGDSFIYYGGVVLNGSPSRYHDEGYFYELCRANGADVSVTNWTYGGKGISYIYNNYLEELEDPYYDYVVFSGGRNSSSKAQDYFDVLEKYMTFFRDANPYVEFLYLVSSGAHNISVAESFPIEILNSLAAFEEMGITIVDWGKMVADIIRGTAPLAQTENTLNKNTFIVHQSDADGYHPNQLTGYLTALMTYIAITGESAVGQSYDFWNDTSLDGRFSPDRFIETYYKKGETNYPAVFSSARDMHALQTLVDTYFAEKAFRTYNFSAE